MQQNQIVSNIIEIVSTIFKFGPTHLVGVDIGLSAIRVAELVKSKKGDYKLVRFSYQDLPEGTRLEDEILKPEEIVSGIVQALKESGISHRNVCIGISGQNTMSKKLQVMSGTRDEIEDQVLWESEQYIPFGIEDTTVSFHIMGQNEGGGNDVIIAAAKNEHVGAFHALLTDAGLNLKVVDLNLFAVANIYEYCHREKVKDSDSEDNGKRISTLIIDFGAQSTNMIIFKGSKIIFTREMNMGGLIITEEIQRQLSLSFSEAEDLKINGDEGGNLPEEIVDVINVSMDGFFNEIKKTINFFMQASAEENVNRCFITGGTSLLPGISEGLEKILGVAVEFLRPMERINFNEKKFSEEEINYISSQGAVVLGLAMRELPK